MEQMYSTSNESMRQLLEIAICCGRCWQSPQTGLIHYSYQIQDENVHHTIPTYENFIFALALFRSRNADNISDSKEILRRLLNFQSREGESAGNFPIYVHDYPSCKDRLWGAHILAPLYWIYKNFHHVLGGEIKQSLKMALIRLQNYCLQTIAQKSAPYPIAFKVAACAKAVGALLDQGEIIQKGERLYRELLQNIDKASWNTPTALSDLILGHQMLNPNISNTPDKAFWDHLISTWHRGTCSYCGPGWKEYQRGKEPQVTLYDYYMGYLTNKYSLRCFIDHPVQLQAALVHPSEDQLPNLSYPFECKGMINGLPWQLIQKENAAISVIAKEDDLTTVQEKTFAPLKILWGNFKHLHSLVCQGGTSKSINYTLTENQAELLFSFSEPVEADSNEKNQEISFYINHEEGTQILVEGAAATTFRLDEQVVISAGDRKVGLVFHLLEGNGEFVGHIMKSNRPSQFSLTGVHRFEVYDWQIFLRTIRRSDDCTIKVKATILD